MRTYEIKSVEGKLLANVDADYFRRAYEFSTMGTLKYFNTIEFVVKETTVNKRGKEKVTFEVVAFCPDNLIIV